VSRPGRSPRGCRSRSRPVPGPEPDAGPDAGSDAGHDPGTDTLDPAEVAQWAEFHRQVDALPEELRAVFRLRWYLDLTTAEVAQTLGLPTRTVTERWVEARLRLGAALPASQRPVPSL
jgi:DNA-directed RNA polymerase specialized sigma24 family protein